MKNFQKWNFCLRQNRPFSVSPELDGLEEKSCNEVTVGEPVVGSLVRGSLAISAIKLLKLIISYEFFS